MTTFLDAEEVQALTGKIRRPSQIKVLRAMGIEHKVRPDGSVAILRAHITKVFDGSDAKASGRKSYGEPNWDALNAS